MRLVLLLLVHAVATLARGNPAGFNPSVPLPAKPDTNAKRLALGMPLLKPKTRHHRSGTRIGSAPRAQTSPTPPIHVSCNVLAAFLNGTTFGYLSPAWNENNTYYAFQSSQEGALTLSFSYTEEEYKELSLLAVNGPAANTEYPYFGAVLIPESVDDNFVPINNHAYLAGTTATPPGSPAVAGLNSFNNNQHMQTAIWVYGSAGRGLIPQWINPDDSRFGRFPATNIVYILVEKRLVITGNPLAILNNYAFQEAEILRFTCVPPAV